MNSNIDMAGVIGQAGNSATLGAAANAYLNEQNQALAEKQLNVKGMRAECYYILSQFKWNPGENGEEWTAPADKSKNILTDEGVDRFMQIIHFYINQSNLLSNFGDDEIKYLMQKFLLELNDLVLLKYEFLFREPTIEQCEEILHQRIENKVKMKVINCKLYKQLYDENKIRDEFSKEINTEYELKKIRIEQRKQRLREFSMILAQLEVIVLGALNRALGGEERGSLRRHTQMLEMLGAGSTQQAKETGGMFKWLKG